MPRSNHSRARTAKWQQPVLGVAAGTYYYKTVRWAVEKDITAGTSATTFIPEATCTRAQVVTFLHRDVVK